MTAIGKATSQTPRGNHQHKALICTPSLPYHGRVPGFSTAPIAIVESTATAPVPGRSDRSEGRMARPVSSRSSVKALAAYAVPTHGPSSSMSFDDRTGCFLVFVGNSRTRNMFGHEPHLKLV